MRPARARVRRWLGALIVVLAGLVLYFASGEEGVVGDGLVTELTDERVCIQEARPPPATKVTRTRCHRIPDEADIEDSIEQGDIVRVRSIDGKIVSVQAFPLD
ncbi:MAG: hypothetical protein ACRDJ2_06880 [Actinomycetota bacterium]